MSRFYVTPDSVRGGKIYAGKEESHHIAGVMRLKEGDKVSVFDGCGREYAGTIESIKNKNVIINIEKTSATASKRSVEISLAQALIKKDKLDYIVEKATELGVSEIIPVETGRAVVRADERTKGHKLKRWQKIIIEAAKQCGRTDLPDIKNVSTFEGVLKTFPQYDAVLMPCLSEKAIPLKEALVRIKNPKHLLLMIGPEGDFTPEEIEEAEKHGAVLVSLGGLVLKSDTAAVATLAMLNHAFL